MKLVLVGYVWFTCQIQVMSDMIEAWKVPYYHKSFTQININNNKKIYTILYIIFIIYM